MWAGEGTWLLLLLSSHRLEDTGDGGRRVAEGVCQRESPVAVLIDGGVEGGVDRNTEEYTGTYTH